MYIASVVEKKGYSVDIININKDDYKLDFSEYSIVGFSITSSITYPIIKKCRFSSKYNDSALIIAGGFHVNLYPSEVLIDLNIEIVSVGEGESTILEIIKEYESRDFSTIKGIRYKQDSNIVITEHRDQINYLNDLPFPARHLMLEENIILNNRLSNINLRMTHIMFSRGCPFTCYFCASSDSKLQLRSGENVRKELIHLKNEYGIEGFSVVDDNNILNKNNLFDICEAIKDLNLKWNALSRMDVINKEKLIKMQESGCIEVVYGLESGSERILKLMNKKINLSQAFNAILNAFSIGMKVKIFLIHGFPGENIESTNQTINFLEKIKHMVDRVSLFRFVPLPGSYVFNNHIEFNLNINYTNYEEHDWEKYHIHHNYKHWWGDNEDFSMLNEAYSKLEEFINKNWT